MAKAAFSDWLANTSIPLEVQGCGPTSTCRAKVHAPGLATHNCTNIIQPISRAMLFSPNSTWGNYHLIRKQSTYLGNGASAGNGTVAVNPAFEVQLNTVLSAEQDIGPEMISVSTGFLRFDLKYGGNFTARLCYYQPAILEYDGQFQDGNLLLPADTSSSRVVAIVNNTRRFDYDSNKAQSQTLVYFYTVYAAYSQVNATVVFQEPAYAGQPWSFDPLTLNAYAMQFLGQHDGVWFEDPMPNIVSSFNNMMVRGSVAFSQSPQSNTSDLLDADVSLQQLVIGTKVTTLNVFRTEFGWFVAAAVICTTPVSKRSPLKRTMANRSIRCNRHSRHPPTLLGLLAFPQKRHTITVRSVIGIPQSLVCGHPLDSWSQRHHRELGGCEDCIWCCRRSSRFSERCRLCHSTGYCRTRAHPHADEKCGDFGLIHISCTFIVLMQLFDLLSKVRFP